MKDTITLTEETHTDDKTGRVLRAFCPAIKPPRAMGSGQIKTAVWQMWDDEPETHGPARKSAIANARAVLKAMARAKD